MKRLKKLEEKNRPLLENIQIYSNREQTLLRRNNQVSRELELHLGRTMSQCIVNSYGGKCASVVIDIRMYVFA